MNHLESLIKQFYEWKGYIVRNNVKVGRLSHGGWECELDIVAYDPITRHLIHIEPSIDAHPWKIREKRFQKKFNAGNKFIRTEVFPWLEKTTPLEQKAILITSSRKELSGGKVVSIDEFLKTVKDEVLKIGIMGRSAIPEQFDILRTIQMVTCGYYRVV